MKNQLNVSKQNMLHRWIVHCRCICVTVALIVAHPTHPESHALSCLVACAMTRVADGSATAEAANQSTMSPSTALSGCRQQQHTSGGSSGTSAPTVCLGRRKETRQPCRNAACVVAINCHPCIASRRMKTRSVRCMEELCYAGCVFQWRVPLRLPLG